MTDILIEHDGLRIECEINGLNLKYAWSDDPKHHEIRKLLNESSYMNFKNAVNDVYNSAKPTDGWRAVSIYIQSYDVLEFFEADVFLCDTDPRDADEIKEYLDEAFDKVWLMRNCYVADREPVHEVGRPAVEHIINKYHDIRTGREYMFESQAEAARQLGVFQPNITHVLTGFYKQTGGYRFEYLDKDEFNAKFY